MAEGLKKPPLEDQPCCRDDFPELSAATARTHQGLEKPRKGFKKDFKTLKNILHARICYKYCYPNCTFPKCSKFKNILLHLSHCFLGKECKECATETRLISHWLWCHKADCDICMPFKGSNRKVLESSDLKLVSFRPSSNLGCKAKALYFDRLKSEVTVVINISELYSSSHVDIELEQFMFNDFPWNIRLFKSKEKNSKAKTLDIQVFCNRDSELPFWRFDCIFEFRLPTGPFIKRAPHRFHKSFNKIWERFWWQDIVESTVYDSFIIEIYISSVTFQEIWHDDKPPQTEIEGDLAHNLEISKQRVLKKPCSIFSCTKCCTVASKSEN